MTVRNTLSAKLKLHHVLAFSLIYKSQSWQQWNYSSFTTDDWRDTWGFAEGPRGRQGHSMVVWDESKVVMFGGRDNEVHRPHVPKTFDLKEDSKSDSDSESGSGDVFKPLQSGYDPSCVPEKTCVELTDASSGNNEACTYSWQYIVDQDVSKSKSKSANQRQNMEGSCGFAISAQLYNDLWVYDLDCQRFADTSTRTPCDGGGGEDGEDDGWRVLHPGKRYGGCRDEDGVRVCDTPSERWGHGAAMIDSSTLVVYGGYSQECQDYCDDVWAFDFHTLDWQRISMSSDSEPSPGKRWKFSMISVSVTPNSNLNSNSADAEEANQIIVFGGHRLWHGFANENSQENRWESTDTYPEGGYLNDLWVLEKNAAIEMGACSNETTTRTGTCTSSTWVWTKQVPKESCVPAPGIAWEDRNNVHCEVYWPRQRSGHAATFDRERNRMWIHGGYSAHYPYPSSTSSGSGTGVKSLREKGFIPFASQSFFLDDLWYYDIDTGIWTNIRPSDSVSPIMRTNHVMTYSRNMLILNGGYSHNHHFNDTWYFDIEKNRWLEKTTFVHALYPMNCTDDIAKVQEDDECVELDFPLPLQRAEMETFDVGYQEVLPYRQQEGYTPDPENPLYFGIVKDAEKLVTDLRLKYLSNEVSDERGDRIWISSDVPDGTPIAPFAATAPRQYAKKRRIDYNETLTLDVWEWCISVEGEPTRGKIIDGKFSRANKTIHIPQPRRQTAGWDGCRELLWIRPPSRSGHKGVLVEKYGKMVVYGGLSYLETNHYSGDHPVTGLMDITYDTVVVNDMWTYGIDACPRNCSGVGTCTNGFCNCDPGYYGLDCSNATCPGSVCYYDENHHQHCEHCCYDGHTHNDENEDYIAGVRKIPCRPLGNAIFSGHSNGVCDGFGTCQCAPPFIGDDCSIRDCPDNCNDNGFCSLEFPVARCICKDGYKGDACQYVECLNNCSYPNGECDHTTGNCACKPIYSPYNTSEIWSYWGGGDCSFLLPWCSACKHVCGWFTWSMITITSLILSIIYF